MEFLLDNLPKPTFVLALWLFIAISSIIDLFTGLYKSKKIGYLLTSDGLKRTANKLVLYYSLMTFGAMIDISAFGLEIISIPYVSATFCLFVLVIEGKSVLERANEKERKRILDGAKDVTAILASKDEIAKAIHEYLSAKANENEHTN